MPGESPGVEYIAVNPNTIGWQVLERLSQGDLSCLSTDAVTRIASGFNQLATQGRCNGTMFLFLRVAENLEETLDPHMPNWMVMKYGYEIDGSDLVVQPLGAAISEDTPTAAQFDEPEDTPAFEIDWPEVNWVAGYGLVLGQEPLSLFDLN